VNVAELDVAQPLGLAFHAPRFARVADRLHIERVPVSTYGGTGWHRGVRTLPLIIEPGSVVLDVFDRVPELYKLISDIREVAGAGRACRAFVSDLAPLGKIDTHCDEMPAEPRRRFHAPLVTSPLALFTAGATTWHMAAGRVYEIDPTLPHSVINAHHERHRTHLVVDCARGDG
jgi:hypothetical protein